jgi:hypothetical protein
MADKAEAEVGSESDAMDAVGRGDLAHGSVLVHVKSFS